MGRSILKDVDLETLYSMRRDQKMSNQEIANAIGVSYVTVYKLIGPQPKEFKKKRTAAPRVEQPKPVAVAEEAQPCICVKNRTVELEGIFGSYMIDIKKGTVACTNAVGQCLYVSKDNIDDFINELNAIKRKLESLVVGNEMW